ARLPRRCRLGPRARPRTAAAAGSRPAGSGARRQFLRFDATRPETPHRHAYACAGRRPARPSISRHVALARYGKTGRVHTKIEDGELISKMERDLAEMDAMICNTLEFLRAGSTQEKTVRLDLNALLESAVEDMRAVGAHVRLHGRAEAPVPARPQALRRCLDNL